MQCGSIAAEATAALGHTSKGKSGGVNGRGCLSRTCRRHQRRAGREALVQHHQRRSAGWDVPTGIEFSLGHHLSAVEEIAYAVTKLTEDPTVDKSRIVVF